MSRVGAARSGNGSSRPYADYVESEYGYAHSWLIDFLREGHHLERLEIQKYYFSIYVLDSIDGIMSCQAFSPHCTDEVDAAFFAALGKRPSNSKTRIVMLEAHQRGIMSGAYVDVIGWQYQLHPFFFSTHFRRSAGMDSQACFRADSCP